LASNLSRLSGYFAGVVEIEVAEPDLAGLSDALTNIVGLKVDVHQSQHEDDNVTAQEIEFVITGNDRKGIVQELASIITHKGASNIKFSSSRQAAPNWGGGLFQAVARVSLPVCMNANDISEALEELATDIVVDLDEAC
jgi:glycine cleavage system regulatory protein